jgi:hypothetical protein
MGTPPSPVATTPWMENALATQVRTMVQPWMVVLWPNTGLPFEQCCTHHGGSKRKPTLRIPLPSKRQRHSEARSSASQLLPQSSRMRCHGTSPRSRQRGPGSGSPSQSRGGHTKAATAKPLSALPLLTTDRVDNMYHQQEEIHAITATQMAECAHWRHYDSTPGLVWAGTGR